jgi:hypothetical protein
LSTRLKIDGVNAASGKDALLDVYSAAIHAAAESLRPESVKRGSPLGQMEIRKAAAYLENQLPTPTNER